MPLLNSKFGSEMRAEKHRLFEAVRMLLA